MNVIVLKLSIRRTRRNSQRSSAEAVRSAVMV